MAAWFSAVIPTWGRLGSLEHASGSQESKSSGMKYFYIKNHNTPTRIDFSYVSRTPTNVEVYQISDQRWGFRSSFAKLKY